MSPTGLNAHLEGIGATSHGAVHRDGPISKIRDVRAERLLFIGSLGYQLLYVCWGLEFSDTGFNATFFQQIFDDPASVQYNFPYWLTGVVGGLWLLIFADLGILGIRLLGALVFTGTLMLIHSLLKPGLGGRHLRLGLVSVALLLGPTTAFFGLEYNLLTSLLFALASLLIVRGLTQTRRATLFAGGVVLGLNVFARFPNVVGIAMVLPAMYFAWSRRRDLPEVLISASLIVGGFLSAILSVLVLMTSIGHIDLYVESLRRLTSLASSGQSHAIWPMVKMLSAQYLTVGAVLVGSVAFVWIYAVLAAKSRHLAQGVLATATIFLFALMYVRDDFLAVSLLYVYIGLVAIVSGHVLLDRATPPEVRLLFVVALMQVALSPLGSDFGFINQGAFAFVIGLPASIAYVLSRESYGLLPSRLRALVGNAASRARAKQSLVVASMTLSVLLGWMFTYCEARWKHRLVHPIQSPLTQFVFTSRERAIVVNELLAESAKYVTRGDYVLAYDEMPMFYYLTHTRPYTYGLWPKLVDDEVFRRTLERSLAEKGVLPVVIRQKVSTWGNWPADVPSGYQDRSTTGRDGYLREFQERHAYRLAWENGAFQIWVTERPGPDKNR